MKLILVLLAALLLSSCSSSQKTGLTYASYRSTQQFFQTSGGEMSYTDQGQGEVLVLIHGVPTSSWVWRKVVPGLAKKRRVIMVDLLGYGSSSKPKGGQNIYSAVSQARRVSSLLKHLEVKNYSLAMHDMGGLVAWELLRQEPSKIQNLIVFNTIVRDEGFNPPNMPPFVKRQMSTAFSNGLTSSAVLKMTFTNLGLKGPQSLSESECRGYVLPMKEGNGDALYSFFSGLNPSLMARLEANQSHFRKFRGRTLILWGAKDETLTTKQIPFLKKHLRIPEKDIHVYPQNNHFLMEENPGEVVRQINRFLP